MPSRPPLACRLRPFARASGVRRSKKPNRWLFVAFSNHSSAPTGGEIRRVAGFAQSPKGGRALPYDAAGVVEDAAASCFSAARFSSSRFFSTMRAVQMEIS
jgi:hypothetical protein